MWKATKEQNRRWHKLWYRRQKNSGIIYLLTLANGETYVGSTTNSLAKRMRQHKSYPTKALRGQDLNGASMVCVYECKHRENIREKEQEYIKLLSPTLNLADAVKKDNRKKSYNGGVTYNGIWYPTKKKLWEELGRCPYGTFKSRLNRGKSLEEALDGTGN